MPLANLKVPPHSVEAEQSFLGGLMLDNTAWDRVADKVSKEDFYRPQHQMIFAEMVKLASAGVPFDVVTLSDAMKAQGVLDQAGGLAYLAELAKNTPSVANLNAYANIIRERSILRNLLKVAQGLAQSIYEPEGKSSQELLDDAERQVFAISENRDNDAAPESVKGIASRVIDILDTLAQNQGGITGTSTDYVDLDRITAGLQPADMVIVAGRPSMGKTTFAMNIAENVAMNSPKPVLVFSMEMPKEALMLRMLSSLSRVDQSALRSGQLQDHDSSKVFATLNMITERMNLFIDDTAALTPTDLRSRARRLAREHGGLRLIVIDYLQLMRVPGLSDNRVNEVSEISRNIKAIAKELHVPVIALSQLSRKCEDRNDRRPVMSDIRESGSIEQDADLIMFVYRDEVYHPDSQDKGVAEILIRKHRNGPIGDFRLTFKGEHCRFDNYSAQGVY
ncbi:MAG: replicative DNA helicase [Gammaproteobacteria bacterium]|nr:replicative DNA helicase [Gammaproteobacteria bacterium]